jgi:hypothetical protein
MVSFRQTGPDMKRKTKIPENVWNVICTAAIIAVLIFAAYAFFK